MTCIWSPMASTPTPLITVMCVCRSMSPGSSVPPPQSKTSDAPSGARSLTETMRSSAISTQPLSLSTPPAKGAWRRQLIRYMPFQLLWEMKSRIFAFSASAMPSPT